MSFMDSLGRLGGRLVDGVGDVVNLKVQKEIERHTTATRPGETIQPTQAQPTAANPTTGVNSNGETIVVQDGNNSGQGAGLLQNKAVVYGGLGLFGLVSLTYLFSQLKGGK